MATINVNDKMLFEILCIDANELTVVSEVSNLIDRLKGNSKLWKKAKSTKNDEIVDAALNISLKVSALETNEETTKYSFLIKVEGLYTNLEPFRLNLIKNLKDEKFEYIYILTDDISTYIAQQIYPKINILENSVRKYLTLYSATKLGPKWWTMMADTELEKKVNQRINNETVFAQKMNINGKEVRLIDNRAYLIDFDDLGSMIYQKSAGNVTRDDIIKQLHTLTVENLEQFKQGLQTNIKKFFSEFETIKFQEKWEFLKNIRNKVAHNNLFIKEDLDKSSAFCEELISFLKEQNEKIGKTKVNPDDIEIIKENIVKISSLFTKITKSELASELYKSDDWTKRANRPFNGLKNFVTNILGSRGFDIGTSYDLINELERDGYIKIYEYTDPDGNYPPLPAIRVLKSLLDLHE